MSINLSFGSQGVSFLSQYLGALKLERSTMLNWERTVFSRTTLCKRVCQNYSSSFLFQAAQQAIQVTSSSVHTHQVIHPIVNSIPHPLPPPPSSVGPPGSHQGGDVRKFQYIFSITVYNFIFLPFQSRTNFCLGEFRKTACPS